MYKEIVWFKHFCHVEIMYDEERGWGFSIAIPYVVAIWIFLGRFLNLPSSRSIEISIHNNAIWWHIWRDPMGGWSSDIPWYRDGCFHFDNFFFGKAKHWEEIIEERNIMIPMPEKSYQATAKLCNAFWKRPRCSIVKKIRRIHIDIPEGIPHEGKGENSWDCGIDATYGICCPARNIPTGVGTLVGSVLNDRVRYGGWGDWEWAK